MLKKSQVATAVAVALLIALAPLWLPLLIVRVSWHTATNLDLWLGDQL